MDDSYISPEEPGNSDLLHKIEATKMILDVCRGGLASKVRVDGLIKILDEAATEIRALREDLARRSGE